MLVPGSSTPLLAHSAAAAAAGISRSIRLNAPDSAYLSRTPASAGNRRTWTWAGWVKRSAISTRQSFFQGGNHTAGSNSSYLEFSSSNTLRVAEYNGSAETYALETTQVFRDPSAWLHLAVAIDTTQATASNRIKVYVNGSQVTTFSTSSYPSQNLDTSVNNTVAHSIGYDIAGNQSYLSAYLADIYFIDGQALTPSSFTETDATTGQLIPKAFSGSYGSQGWHLEFADNSSNTATTLGKDTSGNGNNWTPNNLSVTAGAGNDSLVDVPTNGAQTDTGVGGEVRGNYCTWNPLDKNANLALSNGNLDSSGTASAWYGARATFAVSTGKWYWEVTPIRQSAGNAVTIGVGRSSSALSYPGASSDSYSYYSDANGTAIKYNNGSFSSYGTSFVQGDVIGVAFDADNGTLTFYRNGSSLGQAFSGLTAGPYFPMVGNFNTDSAANFGQRPFAYTAPSGFKALNTANLPAPLVTKPNTVFDVKLITANNSTQVISGFAFSPDLVWTKSRSQALSHYLYDTVRGAQKYLISNATNAETTAASTLDSFNSDGFTLGANDAANYGSGTGLAWCWDAGSSTVTNTAGSITSSVRANATAGFSVVTFTCPASGVYSFGHGLGVVPSMVIMKDRTASSTIWCVYHSSATNNNTALSLSSTAATQTFTGIWGNGITSSVVGSTANVGIVPNSNAVAYCFAPVVGYSSFGSYTGNGSSTDGPFVYTGFRPRWLLFKNASVSGENWWLHDTARNTYNVMTSLLLPDSSSAEVTNTAHSVDILSNGFKVRTSAQGINGAHTIIYAAFAESPFNYARAR
jgi:hypothetical protein